MIIPYKGLQPQLHPSVYMAEGAKLIGDLRMGERVFRLVQCSPAG